jgi:amino acid adenylation domain-containing protein
MLVHNQVESQAAGKPDKTALICSDRAFTYADLNRLADRVAVRLREYGVGPEVLVGLYAERSMEMVVGLLGILKAGGVYVPLDPLHPRDQTAFVLSDSQTSVLLTQEGLEDQIPRSEEGPWILRMDSGGSLNPAHSPNGLKKPRLEPAADPAAYVMYTSGSEGRPKGVVITHDNLRHYVQAMAQAMGVQPGDTYLHLASIAFASSARQLIMPLCQGATVVIATSEQRADPLAVMDLVKGHGVTLMDMVPPYWRRLNASLEPLDAGRRKTLLDNQLRFVNAHGDVLPPDVPKAWRDRFGSPASILNMYGQTETTGVVTTYLIPAQGMDGDNVPIGSPVASTPIYLLDEHLQPVRPGETGEICVGGPCVARGYLNRPELTVQRFLCDPFGSDSTARLYRTGDLGRQRADGALEMLGRMDRQIKINGLRIDVGGIEATLARHPLIREAAVVVCDRSNGDKRLAAYYTSTPEATVTEKELRDFLKGRFSSPSVPVALIRVATMPLTPNGKINRLALPKPDFSRDAASSAFVPPRDQLEQEIATVWEQALGIHPIGIDDNFVELGGDSLLAVDVVSEMPGRFNRQVTPASLFQKPTIREMARLLRGEDDHPLPRCIVPIQMGCSAAPLFCIHILGKGLGYFRPLARYLGSQWTLYGTAASMSDDPEAPHPRDIRALATYYLRAVQALQPQGPYHLIGFSFGGLVAFEMAQQLRAHGHSVGLLGLLDTNCPGKATWASTRQRALQHLSNLRRFGPKYVAIKIGWHAGSLWRELELALGRLRGSGPTVPKEADDELLQQQLRHEHKRVNRNYRMRVYPGKVTFFSAAHSTGPKVGWTRYAGEGLTRYDIPGDHLDILREPNVRILAQRLRESLDR